MRLCGNFCGCAKLFAKFCISEISEKELEKILTGRRSNLAGLMFLKFSLIAIQSRASCQIILNVDIKVNKPHELLVARRYTCELIFS